MAILTRIAVGAAALTVLFAVPAGAAVTASEVTSPAGATSYDVDLDHPGTIRVTGTATASDPASDKVDIRCTTASDSVLVMTGVDLTSTGTFDLDLPLFRLDHYSCRLRAVPAGETPASLAAFSGPVVHVSGHSSNPPDDPSHLTDFMQDVSGPQGYWSGESTSACFVGDTHAFDPATLADGQLFGCSAIANGDPTGSRASLQVDGKNAFLPAEASIFPASGLEPLRDFTRRFDPATGDATLSQTEPVVRCADGSSAYPPTCPAWTDAGVTDRAETVGDHGGRLVRHTDTWTNSGSTVRHLDVFYEVAAGTGSPPSWKFPGQGAYASYDAGGAVSPPPAGVGTAFVAADPGQVDYAHPRGSLTWSVAPAEVSFAAPDMLYLHYRLTVPAGGSTAVTLAYATDGTQAGVDALSQAARAALTPAPPASDPTPAPAPAPGPAPAATPPPPTRKPPVSNAFTPRLTKPHRGAKTVKVTVTLPGAGTVDAALSATGTAAARTTHLAKLRKAAARPGRITLTLKLTRQALKLIRSRHSVRARIAVTFTPSGGAAATKSLAVTLRR
jgi:hypothetical protein